MDSYQILAKYYDQFQDTEERDQIFDLLLDFIKQQFPDKAFEQLYLADLGCGTGVFTIPFLKQGFQVEAIDLASSMVAVLEQKVVQLPPKIRKNLKTCAGNLITHKLQRQADIIIALTDTMNHLTPQEFVRGLANIGHNIKPQGLLIFDLLKKDFLQDERGNNTFFVELDGVQSDFVELVRVQSDQSAATPETALIWENTWVSEEETAISDFTFFEKQESGLYSRSTEQITEYYHAETRLLQLIGEKYNCLQKIHFPERIMYILKRAN